MRKLSWTTRRSGEIYCAPACGGGCLWSAYLGAKAGAAKLVKELGVGWKAYVWENLGWHYAVQNGGLSISPNGGSFTAYIGDHVDGTVGGWWAEIGRTSKAALRKAIEKGMADVVPKEQALARAHVVLWAMKKKK